MTKRSHRPPQHPLEALRVRRDWSYAQLAVAIEALTGVRRHEAAWLRICQGTAQPRRTTQDAIDRFLVLSGQGTQTELSR
jgi:hypothetical protein